MLLPSVLDAVFIIWGFPSLSCIIVVGLYISFLSLMALTLL